MLNFIDGAVIVISLLLAVCVVPRAVHRKRSGTEYLLGAATWRGRSWECRCSRPTFRRSTVIGMAGDGYLIGLVAGGYEWVRAWDLIILASVFAPRYLRSRVFTIPEFLERRFGWSLRALLSANLPAN